jgi:uncharacterized protein (TIGR03382 family)
MLRMVSLGVFWLLVAPASAQVPIVYTRCAHTTATMDLTVGGVTRTMRGLDVYDVLPDVTHFLSGFNAPCDLVLREADGSERVLYDCSSTSSDAASCAAMDPAVSFDGRTIAFAVFRGPLEQVSENVDPRVIDPGASGSGMWIDLPNRVIAAERASLHLVDVATGVVTELPSIEGHFDTGPAFLPNGRIVFTSTRDDHRTTIVFGTGGAGSRGVRLYTVDPDGRNLDLAGHHSIGVEEHPFVLRDGRVAYSSWQLGMGLPFRYTNGSPGGFTTIANLFHIYTSEPDGAHNFAFYGQHAGDHSYVTSLGHDHKAAHFITQTSDGRVWFADYYRGNNNGFGVVAGVMPEPEGQEGIFPGEDVMMGDIYAPRDAITLARWATSGDNMAAVMEAPRVTHPSYADPLLFAGKLSHPAALPDNGLMVSWAKGPCSTVSGSERAFEELGMAVPPLTSGSGSGTAMNLVTSLGIDNPGCDAGVYRATTIPLAHPRDLELVVDSEEWHEIQARAVVPYSAIHGVDMPADRPRADTRVSRSELEVGTPFGLLGAASILDRETHPQHGIRFQGEHQFHLQGTDTIDYGDDELCGVCILAVLPNRGDRDYEAIENAAGERLAILGEIAVRNYDGSGAPRMDPSGNPDTSFLVRFPANAPYFMQGIDCDGRTLNTDQTWQALRPGEMKTCGGCHVHSRASRVEFDQTFASTAEYRVQTLGEGTVPLLAGSTGVPPAIRTVDGYGMQVDFARDIFPIFERRCVSCHGGASPAANLALDRPGMDDARSGAPSTWWCLADDGGQQCLPEAQRFQTGLGTSFRRPQLSRYVRAFNSRGSLLYWKAANRRTDNRTDDQFTEASARDDIDLDFGADHPTEITPEELGLLSRWIDLGSPGGPMELRDTQRPTLHLSAITEGESVTELRVGTVDVGSGIDPASLVVCVLAAGTRDCETTLTATAQMHGVAPVALDAPLSDLDREVLARVADVAGNVTEAVHTVRWLLSAPPPPPPAPDGGVRPDGGTTGGGPGGTDGDVTGGCGCSSGSSSTYAWIGLALLAVIRRRR